MFRLACGVLGIFPLFSTPIWKFHSVYMPNNISFPMDIMHINTQKRKTSR